MKTHRFISATLLLTMLLVTALPAGASVTAASFVTPVTAASFVTPVTALSFVTSALAQSIQFPTEDAVNAVMANVNEYWLTNSPYPGDNRWERAVYYTGDYAHYETAKDYATGNESVYLEAAVDWAETNHWQLNGGCSTQFADNHVAAQTYIDLYRQGVAGADLSCTLSAIEAAMTWAWMEIDLGSEQTISQVNLYPFVQRAYRYYIQVKPASGDSYTTVVNRALNTESNSVLTNTFAPTTARYVRLWVIGADNYIGWLGDYPPVAWVSINEMEVLDTAGTNVALHQAVSCSSESQAENPCTEAVDGIHDNDENRWAASLYSAFVEESPNWWWIDAMYMAMPVYAKLAKETDDPTYLDVMYVRFQDTKHNRSLYDAEEGLWYRDDNYIYPKIVTPNGEKVFWSRGNGWVFAALARVLSELSPGDVGYADYLATYQTMAAALKAAQRPEGYWNSSLADPIDFPGPESSGTAFFAYGLAWGINHEILDQATYGETVAKAWQWMVSEAVHEDGRFGYVQPVGERPGPADYSDTMEYGVGAFLLAGSEVIHLAQVPPPRPNLALHKPVVCSSEPEPENPCTNVVDGDLINRWSATPYEQWVEVDIGGPYQIDTTKFHPYQERAYQYYVEAKAAVDEPYTVIVDRSTNTEGGSVLVDTFPATTARYVRLRIVGVDQQISAWASVREFEIFGTYVGTDLVVNSTADPGDGSCDVAECTLHEAIALANARAGQDQIVFAVPGIGPHRITLNEPLPIITDAVLIDGYSQPGAHPATATDPEQLDAVLLIEIDGHNLPVGQSVVVEGLRIEGAAITVRGLALNGFTGAGIQLGSGARGVLIDGNFLGTDAGGTVALPNGNGIALFAAAPTDTPNRIVGNLISGNGRAIRIEQAGNVLVEGNLIGLARNGEPLGNGSGIFAVESSAVAITANLITQNEGIGISAQRVGPTIADNDITENGSGIVCMVNGACVITHNYISRNQEVGIDLGAGEGTVVQDNRITLNHGPGLRLSFRSGPYLINGNIFNANEGNAITVLPDPPNLLATIGPSNYIGPNDGLGIDLQDDGITLNDPGDDDNGVNGLQNFPTVGLATLGNQTRVAGVLNSKPNEEFTLAFYGTVTCDLNSFGAGAYPLGTVNVQTDAKGIAFYDLQLPNGTRLGEYVTATATGAEGTSEFSSCRYAGAEIVNDQFVLQSLTDRYDPTPIAYAPGGVVQISATFVHNGDRINRPYARVATLSNDNLLLNADDGPGGMGSVLSGPAVIEPNATFALNFAVGLQAPEPFEFYVDLYGFDLANLNSATPDPAHQLKFNMSVDEAGLELVIETAPQIFLPLIRGTSAAHSE